MQARVRGPGGSGVLHRHSFTDWAPGLGQTCRAARSPCHDFMELLCAAAASCRRALAASSAAARASRSAPSAAHRSCDCAASRHAAAVPAAAAFSRSSAALYSLHSCPTDHCQPRAAKLTKVIDF